MADIFVAPPKNRQKVKGVAEENHMDFLCSFCKYPKGISFQAQKEDESTILFLRPHIITNLPWILLSIVFILLPLIATIFLPTFGITFFSSVAVIRFTIVYLSFYYLIVFSYMFINFLTWFYNIFIVTPERIVDINYTDIVVHDVSETKLNQIEDVRYAQSGFIPTLFSYGNLYAQTAGERENFEACSIPNPKEATDIIASLIGGHE